MYHRIERFKAWQELERRIALRRERKKKLKLFCTCIFIHDILSMGKRKAEEEIEIGGCRGVENKNGWSRSGSNFSTRGKTSKSKQTEV